MLVEGEFKKGIILMIGEGKYDPQRVDYLGKVSDMNEEAKKEFLNILRRQYTEGIRDENERLRWFIKWYGSCKELQIDEDGFVKWVGEKLE